MKNSFKSAYLEFNYYVKNGHCPFFEEGFTPFQKVIPQDIFYQCFDIYYSFMNDSDRVIFSGENISEDAKDDDITGVTVNNLETLWKPAKENIRKGRIVGWYDKGLSKRIENASKQGI